MSESYPPPVDQLLTLGDVRGQGEWADYAALGIGPEHVDDLVRMVLDDELHLADGESDLVWAPLHAWRALGQLRAERAAGPLTRLLERIDRLGDDWVGEELPEVFGMIGAPAVPVLREYLADPAHGLWARVAAAAGLAKIGEDHPQARDACVEALAGQLERFADQDLTLNSFIVHPLIDLRAVEVAPVMERAFAAEAVDLSIQGDWEDVQIAMGLLDERRTPKPAWDWGGRRIESQQRTDGERREVHEQRQRAHQARKKVKRQRKRQKKARKRSRKR